METGFWVNILLTDKVGSPGGPGQEKGQLLFSQASYPGRRVCTCVCVWACTRILVSGCVCLICGGFVRLGVW